MKPIYLAGGGAFCTLAGVAILSIQAFAIGLVGAGVVVVGGALALAYDNGRRDS